jgi:hypothetical protein
VPGSVARLAPESFRYGGKCLQKFIYLIRVNAVQIYENEAKKSHTHYQLIT